MIHFKKNRFQSIVLFFLCLHAYPIKSHNHNFVIHNTKIIFLTIAQYLRQIKHHIVDQYTKQYNKQVVLSTKEIPCIEERISIFFYALKTGRLTELLVVMQDADLAVAEKAFCALKKYWPYHREYTFLIPDFNKNNEEFHYAKQFGQLMKEIEISHITRNDYMTKYVDAKSFKRVYEYATQCIELQKEGDLDSLWNEIIKLRNRVMKNGRKTVLADNVCLAIVEKIYRDPVTKLIYKVKYAPTLKEADDAVKAVERYLSKQGKEGDDEQTKYTCPCCGSKDRDLARGDFDICYLCYWEEGTIRWQNPDYIRSANDLDLHKARQDNKKF